MIHNETLYVSGGMTNIPFFNFPMFDEVEHECILRGAKHVYSPAENDRRVLAERGFHDTTVIDGFAEGDVARYEASVGDVGSLLTWDFNVIINECDSIVMLPGWEKSTGAKWERIIAEALGKLIYLASQYVVDAGPKTWKWEFTVDTRPMYLTNLLKGAVNDATGGSRADRVVMQTSPLQRAGEDIKWAGPSAIMPGLVGKTVGHEFDQQVGGVLDWHQHTVEMPVAGLDAELLDHRAADEDAEHRVFSATGGAKGSKNTQLMRLPQAALEEVARHFFDGSCKYADAAPGVANWMLGYDWSLGINALDRHFGAWKRGEDLDTEFDRTHLAAVVFHALVLMTFEIEGWGTDDRYTAAKRNEFVAGQQ